MPVGMPQLTDDRCRLLAKRKQFHLPLDRHVFLPEMLGQESLGFVLGNHERKTVGAFDAGSDDVNQTLPMAIDAGAPKRHAGLHEGRREVEVIEQLQRPAPNHQCFRLVIRLGCLLDNAASQAVMGERSSHRQSDGTSANNQNFNGRILHGNSYGGNGVGN